MNLQDALQKVYDLASQNALDPEQVDAELLDEALEQEQALELVNQYIIKFFNEDEPLEFMLQVPSTPGDPKFLIHSFATFKYEYGGQTIEWLITDGLGNLGKVLIRLSRDGVVKVRAEEVLLNKETGDEIYSRAFLMTLFNAERALTNS